MTKYGIISDIHENPDIMESILRMLKFYGAEKLIINGDISKPEDTIDNSRKHTSKILKYAAESGLETYVLPGSHENYIIYSPLIESYEAYHTNIIDATKTPIIDFKDHKLMFIPGSDSGTIYGEYSFGFDKEMPTGIYMRTFLGGKFNGFVPYDNIVDYVWLASDKMADRLIAYKNLEDYKGKVSEPDKTIAICHVPMRFKNIHNCADMAYFAQDKEGAIIPGDTMEQMLSEKYGKVHAMSLKGLAEKEGYDLKRENRGNEELKQLYEELGITKAVSGHFHESSHRAHSKEGLVLMQDAFTPNLFWNSGHGDKGHAGFFEIKENQIKYINITAR